MRQPTLGLSVIKQKKKKSPSHLRISHAPPFPMFPSRFPLLSTFLRLFPFLLPPSLLLSRDRDLCRVRLGLRSSVLGSVCGVPRRNSWERLEVDDTGKLTKTNPFFFPATVSFAVSASASTARCISASAARCVACRAETPVPGRECKLRRSSVCIPMLVSLSTPVPSPLPWPCPSPFLPPPLRLGAKRAAQKLLFPGV